MRHGGPAFARPLGNNGLTGMDNEDSDPQKGMTLRDYFAAAALVVIRDLWKDSGRTWTHQDVAEEAYFVADAMLHEKEEWEK